MPRRLRTRHGIPFGMGYGMVWSGMLASRIPPYVYDLSPMAVRLFPHSSTIHPPALVRSIPPTYSSREWLDKPVESISSHRLRRRADVENNNGSSLPLAWPSTLPVRQAPQTALIGNSAGNAPLASPPPSHESRGKALELPPSRGGERPGAVAVSDRAFRQILTLSLPQHSAYSPCLTDV
jgi:hypothetical protein